MKIFQRENIGICLSRLFFFSVIISYWGIYFIRNVGIYGWWCMKLTFFTYLFLGIIVLAGAYIRLMPIFVGDTLFLFDQGRDMWDVKKIVYDRDFTLIGPFTGINGVFNGAYHYYLLAIPAWLSNGHPMAGSYFNALVHVLAILLCYLFGKRMFGTFYGITLALFYAFSRYAVGVTQSFWNPNWIPAFMVPFIYFFYDGLINRKRASLIIAGFVAGIAANVEVAFGIWLIPVMILLTTFYWPSSWKTRTPYTALVVYAVHFIPHLIFDFRNNFLMTKAVVDFLMGKNVSLGATIPLPERLVKRVFEIQGATVFAVSSNDAISYLLFAIVLACVLYISYKMLCSKDVFLQKTVVYRIQLRTLFFFIIPIIIYYFCFMVFSRTAWPWYWVGLQVFYYFLVAYVLFIISSYGRIGVALSVSVIFIWFVFTIPAYFGSNKFLDQEPGRFSNMLRVVDYIFEDAQKEKVGVYTYTGPIIDYAFSYVLWWRGHTVLGNPPFTAYEHTSDMPKLNTVYLIIEPAPKATPWASKGWEETKTPQGQELWRKEFPGRLTVVKRQISYD